MQSTAELRLRTNHQQTTYTYRTYVYILKEDSVLEEKLFVRPFRIIIHIYRYEKRLWNRNESTVR